MKEYPANFWIWLRWKVIMLVAGKLPLIYNVHINEAKVWYTPGMTSITNSDLDGFKETDLARGHAIHTLDILG